MRLKELVIIQQQTNKQILTKLKRSILIKLQMKAFPFKVLLKGQFLNKIT